LPAHSSTRLAFCVTSLALFEASLELFRQYYWGHGLVRLALLGTMLTVALVILRVGRSMRPAAPPAEAPPDRLRLGRMLAAPALLAAVAALSASGRFAWGTGLARLGMMVLVGALVVGLLCVGYTERRSDRSRTGQLLVAALIALLGIQSLHTVAWAAAAAIRTQRLRLDEGRTTWRAVQALRHGQDPYGRNVLIDATAFRHRLAQRYTLGVGPHLPPNEVKAALQRYLAHPTEGLRRVLVPPPPKGASLVARRELSLFGYKYGPPPLVAVTALAPMVGAAAVPITNGLAYFALLAAVGFALGAGGVTATGAGSAVIALMLDPLISFYFLQFSATDIWPLAFGFGGLAYALRRHELACGVALGLAAASKIVPGGLFLLLLPATRSRRAALACATTILVLFSPFVWWDAWGLLNNFVLWGALMKPASDSWVFGAPGDVVLAARGILAIGMASLALPLVLQRGRQVCAAFAAITVMLLMGAAAMHNNYVPWFSVWVVLGIVELWLAPGAISERLFAVWRRPATSSASRSTRASRP
jgi:hypothetical protein